ncbi:MAG: dephospho-CoA kinase [Pseudomonadota bacterium]
MSTAYIVGLTGGIGSGKSAAAERFAELGAAVVDTDAVAHELTRPGGAAMEPIRAAFGETVITPEGALDRGAMRRLVFRDAEAKGRLEAILHPMIRAETDRRARAALTAGAPYIVLVVPLLVESGSYRRRVNRVAVVDCDEQTQVRRVVARSGLTPEEVRAIMATQVSRAQRLAAADDVIDNEGDLAALRAQVDALHRKYLELREVS